MKKIVLTLVMIAGLGIVSCKSNKAEEGTDTATDTTVTVTDTVMTSPAETTVITDTTATVNDTVPK